MLNQIKVICADMLHMRQLRDNAKKKSNGQIDSIISQTARAVVPDSKELQDLQLSLLEEKKNIEEFLVKLEELHDLGLKQGMNQMVMEFDK